MKKITAFFAKPFFHDYRTLFGLWMLLPIIMWIMKMTRANNYDIYRGSFWNAVRGWNLYLPNPAEYGDMHHYGPVFSLLFAPFAIGPKWIGLLLWGIVLTLFLYWAIRKSQFTKYQQLFILWCCAHEMLTALFMQQFNIAIAATILLAYYLIEKEKDFWAAFFIMLGTFVKAYSIVGLAFFFFSKHKGKFIAALLFWAVVMFVAPMPFFHGWDYIVSQYHEWYISLSNKNAENEVNIMNNLGAGGTDAYDVNVFGGGLGQSTTTEGNVTVNFGDANNAPVHYGDIYGGSALGQVNAADKQTTVNFAKGTLTGNIYGGGLG